MAFIESLLSLLDALLGSAFLNLMFGELAETGAPLLFVSHETALGTLFDQTIPLASINKAGVEPRR